MPPPKDGSNKLPPIPEPFSESEEEEEVEYLLQPPDGGWGWVVVLSVFYCNLISDGIMLSFGTFLQIIAEEFNADKAGVALIRSLMYGVYLMMGPVCAGFSNVFGLRPVAVTGSVVCTVGLILSYFSPWYEFLFFSYGLLGGIGLGLIYMNGLIIVALYFSRLRALAIAITTAGTGIGSVIFPFVANAMLKTTTWRIAFLVEAGMAASMFFATLTFRPLKPKKIVSSTPDAVTIMSKARSARSTKSRFGSMSSFGTRRTTIYVKRPTFPHTMSIVSAYTTHTVAIEQVATQLAVSRILIQPCCPRFSDFLRDSLCKCCKCCICCGRQGNRNVVVISANEKNEWFTDDSTHTSTRPQSLVSSRISGVPSRFIASIPMETSNYMFSRLDLPPKEEVRRRKVCDCQPLKQTVKGMLDCRVLKIRSFIVLCASAAMNMSSFLIIMTYQRDRAMSMGFDADMSTYFLMMTGASNTLWRLLFGAIAIIPGVNNYYLCMSAISLGGVAAMVSGVNSSIVYQFFISFVIGLGMAVFAVLRPVIVIELVGMERIFSATGIVLMIMGIASILGPPMSGGLMQATQNYDVVFYLSGSMFTISGIMLLLIPPVRDCERNREENA